MKKALTKVFGDPQTKVLKRMRKRTDDVNALAEKYKALSDKELRAKTDEFKQQIKDGKSLDDLLPDAFAAVREAADRTLGMRHFDVQLIGGMVLHEGSVAEMKTGEGKTLVATLPVYLNALEGKGTHVVTVNDYLAQRDAGWMGQIYDFLGLRVGVIIPEESYLYDGEFTNDEHDDERFRHLSPCTRREAYEADVTYGTNNEFGFDYLRDNMVRESENLRQRDLRFAIVDEVDSILIDEARTPLIISAPATASGSAYATFAQVARQVGEDDYEKDEKRRTVALNDQGVDKVQKLLNIDNLFAPENVSMIYHMDQALRAEALFKRDKDYVVTEDGEVIIVDEFTGRLMHGRRYSEGLHQAIEAKEGVEVLQESMTLATISFQNYFRLYDKLSGMTGTAATEREEFFQIYKLDVIEVPTNRDLVRDDRPDRIYKSQAGKFKAIVEEVKEMQEKGQPVLIGTASVEKNEILSKLLGKAGVSHEVLNAKNNEREAAIVANAGQRGAVTLATNIAGRGTDIVLGEGIKELGGLHVLGSERHESRRIDNQLRGRAGRQGDPGSTQFFVSAEDDLMRIFGGDRLIGVMGRLGVDETTPIENKAVSRALESAQKKVENHNFDIRKHVVQYDDVMNRHRKATYVRRRELLMSEDIADTIKDLVAEEARLMATIERSDKKKFTDEVRTVLPIGENELKKLADAKDEKLPEALEDAALKFYGQQEKQFTPEILRKVERDIYLQVLDTLWMQHLENMDHLREGITWRSVGQKDPLVEYRREGQRFYETLQDNMRHDTVRTLFHAQPPRDQEEVEEPVETELTRAAEKSIEGGTKKATARQSSKKPDVKVTRRQAKEETTTRAADSEQDARAEKRRKRQAQKKKKQKRKKGRR